MLSPATAIPTASGTMSVEKETSKGIPLGQWL